MIWLHLVEFYFSRCFVMSCLLVLKLCFRLIYFGFSIIRVFLSCLLTFEIWTYFMATTFIYIVFIMELFFWRFYVFCFLLQLFYVHTGFQSSLQIYICLPLKFFSGVSQSSYVLLYLLTILHRKYNFLSEI